MFHQIQQTLQTLRLVPGRQEIRLGHSENLSDGDEAWGTCERKHVLR